MTASAAAPALVLLALSAAFAVAGTRHPVDDVAKKQLDDLVASEDYLAVFWCKFLPIFSWSS